MKILNKLPGARLKFSPGGVVIPLNLFIISILCIILACPGTTSAADKGGLSVPVKASAVDEAAIKARVEEAVSRIRELPFINSPKYSNFTGEEFRDFLLEQIGKQYPDEMLRNYSRALIAFDLVPEGTDLKKTIVSLLEEQAAGLYDPETKRMFLLWGSPLQMGLTQTLLAHELTHAIQDQHYNLGELPLDDTSQDDLALAVSALLEGDAMAVMAEFQVENAGPTMILDMFFSMMVNQEALFSSPVFLQKNLIFPYLEGMKFVNYLRDRGGYELVNTAFRELPRSTEQILHPEKYLAEPRDMPVTVSLPEPKKFSGGNWSTVWENTMGEFNTGLLLESRLRKYEVDRAAAGWGGDRYALYKNGKSGDTLKVWETAWDSEKDAAEFLETFGMYLHLKLTGGRSGFIPIEKAGARIDGGRCNYLAVSGNRVLYIECRENMLKKVLKRFKNFPARYDVITAGTGE